MPVAEAAPLCRAGREFSTSNWVILGRNTPVPPDQPRVVSAEGSRESCRRWRARQAGRQRGQSRSPSTESNAQSCSFSLCTDGFDKGLPAVVFAWQRSQRPATNRNRATADIAASGRSRVAWAVAAYASQAQPAALKNPQNTIARCIDFPRVTHVAFSALRFERQGAADCALKEETR